MWVNAFWTYVQNIEEQDLATYSETLHLWLRYVDDTITAVHKNKMEEFHEVK